MRSLKSKANQDMCGMTCNGMSGRTWTGLVGIGGSSGSLSWAHDGVLFFPTQNSIIVQLGCSSRKGIQLFMFFIAYRHYVAFGFLRLSLFCSSRVLCSMEICAFLCYAPFGSCIDRVTTCWTLGLVFKVFAVGLLAWFHPNTTAICTPVDVALKNLNNCTNGTVLDCEERGLHCAKSRENGCCGPCGVLHIAI